jgi:hypothetical protein
MTVTLRRDDGREQSFRIVGEDEADPLEARSPMCLLLPARYGRIAIERRSQSLAMKPSSRRCGERPCLRPCQNFPRFGSVGAQGWAGGGNPPETISELRALEANCAASYFRSWVGMPVRWRGTSRRPIPDNWHSIGARSSPYHLAGNRNAAHPVNAMLNYAYAALESEIRIKAISDGYHPTIGIMHEGSDGSSKFIFDLMEPERPKVDRAVLDFVKGHVFDRVDFVIRSDGVCRLNPEMARTVVTMLWT